MSITPKTPPADDAGECEGMGQISMKISALPGSVLSENQQSMLLPALGRITDYISSEYKTFKINLCFIQFLSKREILSIVVKSLKP